MHGLHINEAIECLSELLPSLSTRSTITSIKVLTGTGHHSVNYARLFPHIKDYLDNSNYIRYKIIKDNKGYSGGFELYLR